MDNNIGLVNNVIKDNNIHLSLFNIENNNAFKKNMDNIKSPKNIHKSIFNIFNMIKLQKSETKSIFNKLLEYYKLLICYVYLNSEVENNERRLFYDDKITEYTSMYNQLNMVLFDIKFDFFSIKSKNKVNYFVLEIDESFENEIKEFIKINELDSNEKLLKHLKLYINSNKE